MHRLMIAAILQALMLMSTLPPAAQAETLLERGTYLMQSIVACGNCHTPKNPDGKELPGMELAGGLRIVEHA
ncbi:MAG: cytochrome C, partial [SAR324 cluster bacterium]|nr:cytochrome C [SAR324 cluster bacterium]